MTAAAVAQRLALDEKAVAAFSGTAPEFAQEFGRSLKEAEAALGDLAPPAKPTGVVATVTSPTAVSVAFAAPGATSILVVSTPALALTYDANDVTSPVAVTGAFVAATAYTFKVTAINANGSSTASDASAAVTPNP